LTCRKALDVARNTQDRASALFARNAWYWVALVMAAVQAATFILMVAR